MRKEAAGNFAEGRVWQRILAQALPLTLAEIVQVTYTIVDRVYLGHLSEEDSMALIGVGVAFPIIALINAFTSLFGQGAGPAPGGQGGAAPELHLHPAPGLRPDPDRTVLPVSPAHADAVRRQRSILSVRG